MEPDTPPRGTEQLFIGFLAAYMRQHGKITPQAWQLAFEASLSWAEVIELDNFRHAD